MNKHKKHNATTNIHTNSQTSFKLFSSCSIPHDLQGSVYLLPASIKEGSISTMISPQLPDKEIGSYCHRSHLLMTIKELLGERPNSLELGLSVIYSNTLSAYFNSYYFKCSFLIPPQIFIGKNCSHTHWHQRSRYILGKKQKKSNNISTVWLHSKFQHSIREHDRYITCRFDDGKREGTGRRKKMRREKP